MTCEHRLDKNRNYCVRCGMKVVSKTFRPATEAEKKAWENQQLCTCASFFTVRGVHKEDCPLYEEKGCENGHNCPKCNKFYPVGQDWN